MTITQQMWQQGETLLQQMLSHPFNQELAAGTLPAQAFQRYLQQDALYIRDYTLALQRLIERSDDPLLNKDLEEFAGDGYLLEKELHEVYFKRFSVTAAAQKNQACHAYCSFLEDSSRQQSMAIALSALLPCFWYYWKVGMALLEQSQADNPYQLWIDLYSGEEFSAQVRRLIAHVDRYAEQQTAAERKEMIATFLHSSHLELGFWDGAYRGESEANED